jgi:hypothetical protein
MSIVLRMASRKAGSLNEGVNAEDLAMGLLLEGQRTHQVSPVAWA